MSIQIGKVKKVSWSKKMSSRIRSIQVDTKHYSIVLVIAILLTISFSIVFSLIKSKLEHTYIVSASDDIQFISGSEIEVEGESLKEQFKTYKVHNSSFKAVDKRIYVLDEYFKSRNSPLYGQAVHFVEACDKYGAPVDCISTAAIARHETDLCNYYNSADYFNCMGWGGAGPHRMKFSSFEEHIYRATDVLVNQYGPEYMDDPRLMERVFCGPQDECINWGNRILFFMRQIDDFSESLGVGRLTDLRDDGLRY